MTPEAQRIAIAEACGWQGVPCEQQWKVCSRDKTKYWRSVTPVEIMDELKKDHFGCTMVARWLRMPNGKPFILQRQPALEVNHYMTYCDLAVTQDFSNSEWSKEAAYGWKFQTDPWPVVTPSLAPFVKHLPDYLNDLNAMHEVEKILEGEKWVEYVRTLARMNEQYKGPCHATAAQKAEVFLHTIGKWEA